jgi:DNA-binding NtrC family response regulator
LLATHFLSRAATAAGKSLDGLDEEAASWMLRHRWPGNVRELENVVERAVALSRGPRITLADMHVEFAAAAPGGTAQRPTLGALEADYVRRVLDETGGDKPAAARILGVSIRALQRRFR